MPGRSPTRARPTNVVLELGYFVGKLGAATFARSTVDRSSYLRTIVGVGTWRWMMVAAGNCIWRKNSAAAGFSVDMNLVI